MLYRWRAAARAVAARRGMSLVVIVTLALGIGANSAIFSAVDAVLLKPLPYPSPERLVSVYEHNAGLKDATQLVAPGRLEEWNAQNRTFDGLAATYFENVSDTSGALPERLEAMRTSPRFFTVLGVNPALGRWPTADEERFGGPLTAVISDGMWRRRFNASPAVIGSALTLGGVRRTIIAVMPPSFRYPTATTDAWLPTQAPRFFLEARTARLYTTIGRLKPGVTVAQAQDDLSAVQRRLGQQFPQTDKGWDASLTPLKEEQVGGVRRSLWLLLGAVALVLLAACGNVACLLIADATRREHEIAVRLAIGADRRRLVGELLREGAILGLAGAAVGLLLAQWGLGALRLWGAGLPRIDEVHVDGRLVVFTLTLGVLTTLLCSLMPAIRASHSDPAVALARGGRTEASGHHWPQHVLVGGQIALAIVLVVGAGLLIRSFARLQATSLGFTPEHVITFRMSAQWSERLDAVIQRQARTIARLQAIPGVESAAFSQLLPARAGVPPIEFRIAGRDDRDRTFAAGRSVSAGYFHTLQIPILQGDTCNGDPAAPINSTALVTRAFAERFFAGENPIGHFIAVPAQLSTNARIIGVVGDVREGGLASAAEPVIYWCTYNPYWPDQNYLVRVDPRRAVSLQALRAALHEIEPSRAVYAIQPLTDVVATTIRQQRMNTLLLALFAATTLLLAAVGVYGVLSQLVSSRQREIGVRIALGARPTQIVASVAAQAMALTTAGTIVGLAASILLTRFMTSMVFGVSLHDPVTLAATPVVLFAVAAAAAVLPARRAARLNPIEVMRHV